MLVVGDLLVDVVALAAEPVATGADTPARVSVTGGGAGGNVAAWLAAAAHPVTLVARVGADPLADIAVAGLAGADLAVTVDPSRPTGRCVVVVGADGTRSLFPDPGASAALEPADLPPGRPGAGEHLHLSGYTLLAPGSRAAGLAALARARGVGATVSLDPGTTAPIAAVGAARVRGWAAGVDLLLLTDDEACLLAGQGDPLAAAAELAGEVGAVVLKRGARGSAWVTRDTPALHAAAPQVAVVDTTGAGDAFTGGVLPAWLAGQDARRCLAAGTSVAAVVIARPGARPR